VELRRKIEEEKEDLKKLQHPPKANVLATEGTSKGEKINDIIACSSEKSVLAKPHSSMVILSRFFFSPTRNSISPASVIV
jgi:hypothetical protein